MTTPSPCSTQDLGLWPLVTSASYTSHVFKPMLNRPCLDVVHHPSLTSLSFTLVLLSGFPNAHDFDSCLMASSSRRAYRAQITLLLSSKNLLARLSLSYSELGRLSKGVIYSLSICRTEQGLLEWQGWEQGVLVLRSGAPKSLP